MSQYLVEGIFAIVVAIGCLALIRVGKNGSATSILALLVGRFLGRSEKKGKSPEDK